MHKMKMNNLVSGLAVCWLTMIATGVAQEVAEEVPPPSPTREELIQRALDKRRQALDARGCTVQNPSRNAPLPTENIALHLRGEFGGEQPIDIQLVGAGPKFTYSGNDDPIMRFEANLTTSEDGILVLSYSLIFSLPKKTGENNYQYVDSGFSGQAVVTYGEELPLMTNKGKTLVLTISKYVKPKP